MQQFIADLECKQAGVPLRHPLRIALCESGDAQLCMTCFARMPRRRCPSCQKPAHLFDLTLVPAGPIDKMVSPSANERAAQAHADTRKEAEFDAFMRAQQQSQAAKQTGLNDILQTVPRDRQTADEAGRLRNVLSSLHAMADVLAMGPDKGEPLIAAACESLWRTLGDVSLTDALADIDAAVGLGT
jgi:hypothetical protein